MGWSGAVGTGLVIGRKDGSWTAPSAISLAGIGWGFQLGGAVSDVLIVLRNRCLARASLKPPPSCPEGLSRQASPKATAVRQAFLHCSCCPFNTPHVTIAVGETHRARTFFSNESSKVLHRAQSLMLVLY